MIQDKQNTDRTDHLKRRIKITRQDNGKIPKEHDHKMSRQHDNTIKALRQQENNINFTFSRRSRSITRNTSPSNKPNLTQSINSPRMNSLGRNTQNLKKQQFEKLLEISSRCLDYYNKFLQEKGTEIQVVDDAFKAINESLDFAFDSLIKQIQEKQKSIKQYLSRRQQALKKVKNQHQVSLTKNLQEIKSTHLANYLKQYELNVHQNQKNIDQLLNSYANTLSKFYHTMEEIQKFNFKENVEESINFINNLITEQIRTIVDQKLQKNAQIDNFSFSFNNQKQGGFKLSNVQSKASLFPDSTHELLQEIAVFQDRRKINIKKYEKILHV